MRAVTTIIIFVLVLSMMIGTAMGLPEILDCFNAKYNTTGTRLDTCDSCHIPNKPMEEYGSLNVYGLSVKNNLSIAVSQAFTTIENLDSDGDRFTNIDEIHNLTFPGSKRDKPKKNVNNLVLNIYEIIRNII